MIMVFVAKVFMNGRSQAVRLPKECRFDCDEVYVEKHGEKLVLSPRAPDWDDFFNLDPAFGDDFLSDREDVGPQEREDS
jgi:antitoxin VapB